MIKIPTNKENLLIIDFEATCADDGTIKRNEMEIIEFAGILIEISTLRIIKEFTEFIKPVKHPKLTDFCIKLTTISQEDVDKAKLFPEVLKRFNEEMDKENSVFSSWGDYDRNQLLQDCKYHNFPYPFNEEHINIKKLVAKHLKLPKPKGIGGTLRFIGLEFDGTPHRGIDDVRNIIRILRNI